jgi:hypothetical protein
MSRPLVIERPPRTAGHAQRDAAIKRFADAGLVPVLSTNGGNPEADIQIVKGPKAGEVLEAWITAKGEARLPAQIHAKPFARFDVVPPVRTLQRKRKPARKPAVSRKKR